MKAFTEVSALFSARARITDTARVKAAKHIMKASCWGDGRAISHWTVWPVSLFSHFSVNMSPATWERKVKVLRKAFSGASRVGTLPEPAPVEHYITSLTFLLSSTRILSLGHGLNPKTFTAVAKRCSCFRHRFIWGHYPVSQFAEMKAVSWRVILKFRLWPGAMNRRYCAWTVYCQRYINTIAIFS